MLSSPTAGADLAGEESSGMKEVTERLSELVFHQEKNRALMNLTDSNAQLMINYLNAVASHPDFLKLAEPKLRERTHMVLLELCENSKLYPTCTTLDGIEDLLQKDGGGGFCDIFQGRYQGQNLCFKVVRVYNKQGQDELLKAYAKEALIWSQLEHPNVTPFYGLFHLKDIDGRICFLYPWMENGNVVEYLTRVPGVSRRPFLDDIARGLAYLHDRNIAHGSLKGVNVLVDEFSIARITNFGISKIRANGTLSLAMVMDPFPGMTARWASPESLELNSRPTREGDVWAFGCVCFEILTGSLPYRGSSSDAQVIRQLIKGELPAQPANDRLHPDSFINKEIWGLLERCWSLDAAKRPRCEEILQTIENNPVVWQKRIGGPKRDITRGRRFHYTLGGL